MAKMTITIELDPKNAGSFCDVLYTLSVGDKDNIVTTETTHDMMPDRVFLPAYFMAHVGPILSMMHESRYGKARTVTEPPQILCPD